jgi:hypothetical protein
MGLETGTYISDLNASNPASGDQKSQGDDHIRLVKSTILATFPNVTGAVTKTHTEINALAASGANADITSLTAITAGGLPNGTITTATIADAAITTAKIDNGQVTIDKLANNSVSTARIVNANVTAAKLDGAQSGSAPIFGVRAWVRFNGTGTVAIGASGNVTSITDRGTGEYTVNFTTAMADANYAAVATAGTPAANTAAIAHLANSIAPTSSAVAVDVITDGGTRQDATYICVIVMR